jgi:hypothetical protein
MYLSFFLFEKLCSSILTALFSVQSELTNVTHTIKVFYSPTDAQVNCLKNNFKIYIKIDIKTAPTCFGAVTIIREHIIRNSSSSPQGPERTPQMHCSQ